MWAQVTSSGYTCNEKGSSVETLVLSKRKRGTYGKGFQHTGFTIDVQSIWKDCEKLRRGGGRGCYCDRTVQVLVKRQYQVRFREILVKNDVFMEREQTVELDPHA